MLTTNEPRKGNASSEKAASAVLEWRTLAVQRPTPAQRRRRRIIGILSIILLALVIFAMVRFTAVADATNDQITLRVGNQQIATLDLRQAFPISPQLFGANVFPPLGSVSRDNASGFMDETPSLIAGLRAAHIGLLRFPGGSWGEQHLLSFGQLSAFSALLQQVGAQGMMQARLSGPIGGQFGNLTSVINRANIAGQWVDFMNDPHSYLRTGQYARAPYYPVKYWTVGDEPDTLTDPATGQPYTVAEYVNDFIQFSTVMHRFDPNVKVFGPDISEFYGPGAGPRDANGVLWMEGFLQGVGAYEKAHNVTLLDGVSFQRYQFTDAAQSPYLFLSATGEWDYLIPALRQMIGQYLPRAVPIAVTGINTNPPSQALPSRGIAALWWADTLAELMNQGVSYVAFSSAQGQETPYPLFTADTGQPTPMYQVMALFSHLQADLIPLEIQRDPVSIYATQDNAHQTVSLLFVNKSPAVQLAQINGASSFFGTSLWGSLNVTLAPYSIIVVTLHRGGSAEAYSFIAPASDNAGTPSVSHIICGQKSDALANTVPC